MRLFFGTWFLAMSHLVFSQVYFEGDSCCLSRFRGQDFDTVDTYELGKDFKSLSTRGDLCCDPWNSDLHKIMRWFKIKLGKEGTEISQVIKLLGMPNGTEVELERFVELEENEKALIYFWRGYHDFLYFVYEDTRVKYAEWYVLGE